MTKHYNKNSEKSKRQTLRNNAPKTELLLWKKLKGKQLVNYKFLRQYIVDQFVLDFYFPEAKLAIEIDGSSHFKDAVQEYDNERQKHIETFGIYFLRFTNYDVHQNLEGVLISIDEKMKELNSPPYQGGDERGG